MREVDIGRIGRSTFRVRVRHMPLLCLSGGHIKSFLGHFYVLLIPDSERV